MHHRQHCLSANKKSKKGETDEDIPTARSTNNYSPRA
jgi:hypothetical protein